jgi:hypothetical protein
MSYDIPQHVNDALRTMMKVADAEIMALRRSEARLNDPGNSPAWGYIAQELSPMLARVKAEITIAMNNGDVMPAVAALHEKIDAFDLDTKDPVKNIFVKATKAMLRSIDPNQYPEIQSALDVISSVSRVQA